MLSISFVEYQELAGHKKRIDILCTEVEHYYAIGKEPNDFLDFIRDILNREIPSQDIHVEER